MTFKQAVVTCFQKYISIEGRAARSEYWYFFLFYILVNFALGPIDATLFGGGIAAPLGTLFMLAVFLPFTTVGIRRLHDRDMSGWWMLLMFIPAIGSLALLVLFVLPGSAGPNTFGPDPLGNDTDWADEDDGTLTQTSIPRVDRE
ncbi:MAG: DUF805 domain-containing protein [Boseongicola sp.]|nr:DUF805 domain-containing protein [Boseongicola sp.]